MERGTINVAWSFYPDDPRHDQMTTIEAEVYGAFAAHPHVGFTGAGEARVAEAWDAWQVTHVATGRRASPLCGADAAREVARRLSAIPGADRVTASDAWAGALREEVYAVLGAFFQLKPSEEG